MSQALGSKRSRANLAGDAHVRHQDPEKIRKNIKQLDREQLSNILFEAAEEHPNVCAKVDAAIQAIREKESRRVISFDYYSKSIWKSINITYSKMNGSKQYEFADDVYHEIISTIKSIVKQCGPLASPQTRWNGLSVLRKIGKTIVLSANDVVGHEVQNDFGWNTALEDGMLSILRGMSAEERATINKDRLSEEALQPKLVELKTIAEGYCVFGKLAEVLDFLEKGEEYRKKHRDENENENENENESGDGDGDGDQGDFKEDEHDYEEYEKDE